MKGKAKGKARVTVTDPAATPSDRVTISTTVAADPTPPPVFMTFWKTARLLSSTYVALSPTVAAPATTTTVATTEVGSLAPTIAARALTPVPGRDVVPMMAVPDQAATRVAVAHSAAQNLAIAAATHTHRARHDLAVAQAQTRRETQAAIAKRHPRRPRRPADEKVLPRLGLEAVRFWLLARAILWHGRALTYFTFARATQRTVAMQLLGSAKVALGPAFPLALAS